MPLSSRAWARLGWLLTALSLIAFVVAMILARPAARPTWDPARFVLLAGAPAANQARTWIVAVNPACAHCRASLPSVVARARGQSPEPALAVLLVDTPARWSADSLKALPAAVVWWDSAAVWRRVWRRTAYGEILVFGADGRLAEELPPGSP